MASTRDTRVLFVPYRPGTINHQAHDGSEISQQKHAAREYHRKARERRQTLKKQRKSPETSSAFDKSEAVDNISLLDDFVSLPVSPRILLGAGRTDPFSSLPVNDESPHAQEMLDFSLTYQWPVFSFCNPGTTVDAMKKYVMSRIMSSASAMYTIVFAGATYYALRRPGNRITQENLMLRLKCKTQALRTMCQEIEELGPKVPNETLYSMLSLAAYGSTEKMEPPTPIEHESPLAVIHDLDFHSCLPCEWAHLRALSHLIKQRGGLGTAVDRPGFFIAMSLYDVLASFQRLEQPAFPLSKSNKDIITTWPSAITHPSGGSSASLGVGFKNVSSPNSIQEIIPTLEHLAIVTAGWGMHQRDTPDAPTLYQITLARTAILHDLLCLPDLSAGNPSTDECLYELCRLGTLSYMLLFLYPLRRQNGPHGILAERLMSMLDLASRHGLWQSDSKFLFWVIFMGGIMARGHPTRCWYVELLNYPCIKHTLVSWLPVSSLLTHYLWLEGECSHEGLLLWREVWMTTQSRAASV